MSRARYVPAMVVTVLTLSIGVLGMAATIRPARLAAAAPADHDRLSAPPATVTLVLNTRPDPGRTHVTVVNSAGGAVTSADMRVTGEKIVQPISIADAGNYRVGYHATFVNGRELSGQFSFTVGSAGPAPADDAACAGHAHGAPTDPLTVGVLVLDAAVLIAGLVLAGWGSPPGAGGERGRPVLYEVQESFKSGAADSWAMPNRQDVEPHQTAAVARAIELMKAGLEHPLSLDDLASAGRFSRFHFHRIFREITTLTPARFLAALRMAEARRLLVHSTMTVCDVSWRVGYESLGTFTTQFGRLVGLSPGRFRQLMRVLGGESVATLLPAVGTAAHWRTGPVLGMSGVLRSRSLVVGGLSPAGALPERPGAWAMAAWATVGGTAQATSQVRLPAAQNPGEYAAVSVVVPADVRVTDAFVDNVPGSYLIGAARMRLPSEGGPGGVHTRVALRRPRPTDPPVLAVTPLNWLVETRRDAMNRAGHGG